MQINQDDYICFYAAKALWLLDEGNANAIATLVQIVAADEFSWGKAADYLLEIDPKNVDMISALTERINTNEFAIATLSQILQSSNYIGYRQRATNSLLGMNPNNKVAIDTLFAVIKYLDQSPPDAEYVECIAWDATQNLQKIDPSNQLAVSVMLNLLNIAEDDYFYIAVEGLGSFAVGNKDAIAALSKLIDSTDDNDLLLDVAHSLGRIDPGNQKAFSTLSEFIQTGDEWDYIAFCSTEYYEQYKRNFQRLDAANKLQEILPINQMPQVVVALKDYLSKSKQDSSYRYEACYRVIWHCAQNMTYPDFYKAWHRLQ